MWCGVVLSTLIPQILNVLFSPGLVEAGDRRPKGLWCPEAYLAHGEWI